MKKVFAILGLMVVFSFYGCDIESGENFQFISLKITAVALPESFEQNTSHNIQVTYERPDNCTFFEGFDVFEVDLNTRSIVAIGSLLKMDECALMQDEVNTSFEFIALNTSSYTLRFYSGDDENGNPIYLEYVIPVIPEGVN
ncbi:hypothetical protein [Croceitalea rosinachiae]|uniref:Lipoprotein n=1 Tax=Croceitalea rosinachiae TaxID=3075596 RepID=A0ABU3A9H3_9FLAO|nr:hypothetical protein [Croceitalea sp. F388]MDT0606182.1 hypothetical protein [Croceitalea sp. F388]